MLNIPEDEPVQKGFIRCPSPLLGATQRMNNLNISPGPRKRASSFKKPKEKFHELVMEDMRPRTSSMPTRNSFRKPCLQSLHRNQLGLNIEPDLETYTVRSFHMNSKGEIVYRSDSLRSRSTNSVFSSEGDFGPMSPSSRTSSSMSRDSAGGVISPVSGAPCTPFPVRVLVLGSHGVGKTALTEQFLTSEYLGGFDTSVDGEGEKIVNVCLEDEETSLMFDVHPYTDEANVPFNSSLLYLIVYACDDKVSFDRAVDMLYNIRKKERRDEVTILVGNKSDLVRTRCVTMEEAKAVAITYGCKFVETSVVLNVNVDELLVGIVKQIRLNSGHMDQSLGCAASSKRLLTKIFKRDDLSKSCGNLYN